jgi:hypothetical protein
VCIVRGIGLYIASETVIIDGSGSSEHAKRGDKDNAGRSGTSADAIMIGNITASATESLPGW